MEWRFFLNDIEFVEPVGWDGVTFTIRRSDTYGGMEFAFSDELTFDREGGEYLLEAYEQWGIDAEVNIRIENLQCGEESWRYEGVINFAIFKVNGGSVTVGIRQSGFTEAFKNRMDVPVNLESPLGVAGGALSDMSPQTVRLHSKEIQFVGAYKINPQLAEFSTIEFGGAGSDIGHVLPFEMKTDELEGALQPGYYIPVLENPVFYSGFEYPQGVDRRIVKLRVRLAFQARYQEGNGVAPMKAEVFVKPRNGAVTSTSVLFEFLVTPQVQTFDSGVREVTLSLPVDTNVFLQIHKSVSQQVATLFFKYSDASFLDISENSTFPPSTARVYLVHELLSRITESITGVTDAFRSDFFGRTDSTPHAYPADGAGSLLAITNGLSLRNMLDRNGQPFPVTCSFEQAFRSLDAIYCLGMRVERETSPDGEEKEYVRVEPREYFYNRTVFKEFPYAEEIERTVQLELLPNEFECGYSKWETEAVNGIDEFNTKRNYVLPVRANKRKLTAISEMITGGYAIEFTRRRQFSTSPTTDYKTDNDLFAICLVRAPDGYEAERHNGFEPVTNLFSPWTAYNIRISPARMARRWAPVLAASVYRSADKTLRFQSGTGNYQMQAAGIAEDGNLLLPAVPLFQGELISFDYPMNLPDFLSLREGAIFALAVSCSEEGYLTGFIREVSYEPNRNGGIAKLKLVRV